MQHDLRGATPGSADCSPLETVPNHLPKSEATWLAVQQHALGPHSRATLIDKAISARNITHLFKELYDPACAASRPIFTVFYEKKCRWWGSNPHDRITGPWILSPMRLPFRHSDLFNGPVVYRMTRLSGTALSIGYPWISLPILPAYRIY